MPSKSQFTESLKVTSSAGTQVDSSKALDSVQSWIQTTSGLPQHDHAMMFTRYVMQHIKQNQANNKICSQNPLWILLYNPIFHITLISDK